MPIETMSELLDDQPPDRTPYEHTLQYKVTCGFAVAVLGALALLLGSVFFRTLEVVRKVTCRANMNQVSAALTMYSADYGERMPPAHRWTDCLYPYTKNWGVFQCEARPSAPGGFAFNRLLSNRPLAELNFGTLSPAIFESSIGTLNASDELQSFITPHDGESCLIHSTGWIQRISVAPSASAGIRETGRGSGSKPSLEERAQQKRRP